MKHKTSFFSSLMLTLASSSLTFFLNLHVKIINCCCSMYKRERDFLKNYSKEEAAGREEELNWRLIEARWKCETWMKTTTNERCQCYLGSRVEMMVKKYFLNIYYNSDLNLYQIVWYMWKIFKFSRAPRERHLKQLSSSSLKLPPQQQPTKEETTVIVFLFRVPLYNCHQQHVFILFLSLLTPLFISLAMKNIVLIITKKKQAT